MNKTKATPQVTVALRQLGQSRVDVVALRQVCYSLAMALVRLLFCGFLLVIPYIGSAEGAVDKEQSFVMCRSQKVVRTIRITPGGEGCQTVYTKGGVDRVVGTAKSQLSCLSVMKNIRTNLESAEWKCKDVDTATLSNMAE
jgi:hypothetical protein